MKSNHAQKCYELKDKCNDCPAVFPAKECEYFDKKNEIKIDKFCTLSDNKGHSETYTEKETNSMAYKIIATILHSELYLVLPKALKTLMKKYTNLYTYFNKHK